MLPGDQGPAAPPRSTFEDDADAELWEELLQFIEEGCVIPVVGRDLLTVERNGKSVLLYELLAERLAEALEVDASGLTTPSLNEVAIRYVAAGGDPERIYSRLLRVVRGLGSLDTPEPLRQLASIRPFKLFVSTTFDSLVAQAINEVRFKGADQTGVLAYSPREKHDLPGDFEALQRPLVFQLLGRLSANDESCVVTEEDALEFVHSLQAPGYPINLFSALNERPLLIIGCSFPGWLVRFFVRAARRYRLRLARGKTDFVVDRHLREETELLGFLRNFKTRIELFQLRDPIAFVSELHRRWQARTIAQPPADALLASTEPQKMTPGSVFVSYASEDRQAAQAIARALDTAGLDVWFDREQLFAGEAFEAKIRRNIESCSLFVPILSRSCVTPERRFFRVEWDQAQRVALTVPESARFILPVVIDDLPPDHGDIPAKFRTVQWERAPEGRASAEFVDLVRGLYRRYQTRTVVRT